MNAIAKAVQALPDGAYLLAVSGGPDSMAMLHAFCAYRREVVTAVATFDHATGVAAAEAVELVIRECLVRGVPVVAGRAPDAVYEGRPNAEPPASGRSPRPSAPHRRETRPPEAALREARWAFLRAVAAERRAIIATAHSWDDQAETVAMRILRDASARGLAGMSVPALGVVRPLLGVRRADLVRFSRDHEVPFVEDPSNTDRGYLRNRLRADLLAAIEAVRPGFSAELVRIGARAAAWRAELRALVDLLEIDAVGSAVIVPASALAPLNAASLMVLWPEIAGRAGVTLDRRGLERLATWSADARPGQRIPLSAGAQVERTSRTFVVRGELGVGPPTILKA